MTIPPVMPDPFKSLRDCRPVRRRRVPAESGKRGPLVTVVLPTYNRRRYLAQALASVLRQTYHELEIIVVRDGGEEVSDIVQSVHDLRVALIDRRENRGKPFSLNEALARARGKYVAYLDDDDLYYPGHVRTLVDALEGPTDCQVAYSDLYKTCCEVLPGGDRRVLSKQVEVSRDFDRFLMLYFNHVLHVSLMHRRDLLEKTGLYNEQLNILIDWDITRRLSFFSDFHHVPVVTGEFYSPVGESDRISCQRRKDSQEYLGNILAIRTTRPPKPWPKMGDLSIILLLDRLDEHAADVMLRIWRHTFYPYKLLIPLPPGDIRRLNVHMPNVELIVTNSLSSPAERVDVALLRCEGDCVAIVPGNMALEEMWVEKPLYALMHSTVREGFLLGDAAPQSWAAVLRRTDLDQARRAYVQLSVEASLTAAGIRVRRPKEEELPFHLDNLLREAKLAEADGDWTAAARLFEHMGERFGNHLWMRTMAARAYFEAGDHPRAAGLSEQVNGERPTVDTLLLEAKVRRRKRDFHTAIRLLTRAEQILEAPPHSSAHPESNCCST
jgi:glycosyltransferase involved in cell wall biosynthesis